MSAEEQKSTSQPPRRKTNRPALVAYMIALFAVAFLLLLMSYFMQQRHSDQRQDPPGRQDREKGFHSTSLKNGGARYRFRSVYHIRTRKTRRRFFRLQNQEKVSMIYV